MGRSEAVIGYETAQLVLSKVQEDCTVVHLWAQTMTIRDTPYKQGMLKAFEERMRSIQVSRLSWQEWFRLGWIVCAGLAYYTVAKGKNYVADTILHVKARAREYVGFEE